MKPRSILLLVLLIFACVLGCMLGSFGAGISIPIDGQPVTFKAFIPPISVPAELVAQPTVDILAALAADNNPLSHAGSRVLLPLSADTVLKNPFPPGCSKKALKN